MAETLLVTGGLGFIGSAFVRRVAERGEPVLNVDLMTYAGDERRLASVASGAVRTQRMDVASEELVGLMRRERPARVVHFAAETHVTRSERDPDRFFHSNVEGTRRVLEAAEAGEVGMVVHVSTDEVYGPAGDVAFREQDKRPGEGLATSAYARSKAVADDLALSFADRVPVIVVRPTNCFGPWQHPEKAIARWTTRALRGEQLPVWGDGLYVRDWMHVDDLCSALDAAIEHGAPGCAYNAAAEGEPRPNIEIARMIARAAGRSEQDVLLTSYDRPQHDRRYAIDSARLRALGWRPSADLESAVERTVGWYQHHRDWWEALVVEAERVYAASGTAG